MADGAGAGGGGGGSASDGDVGEVAASGAVIGLAAQALAADGPDGTESHDDESHNESLDGQLEGQGAAGAQKAQQNNDGNEGDQESSRTLEDSTDVQEDNASPEERRKGFIHRRKPSWLNESHPSFVWGDQQTRKQIREEFHRANDELGGSSKDLREDDDESGDDEDDEVDDADLNYGVDPGFADLDEELRVVEGMISEHTKLAEVEVDDESESSSDEDEGEQGAAKHSPRPPRRINLPPPAKSNIAKALEAQKKSSSLGRSLAPQDQKSSRSDRSSILPLVVKSIDSVTDTDATSGAASSAHPPSPPHKTTENSDNPSLSSENQKQKQKQQVESNTTSEAANEVSLSTSKTLEVKDSAKSDSKANADGPALDIAPSEVKAKDTATTTADVDVASSSTPSTVEAGSDAVKDAFQKLKLDGKETEPSDGVPSEGVSNNKSVAAGSSSSATIPTVVSSDGEDMSVASSAASPQSRPALSSPSLASVKSAPKPRKKRVRLVELPDYLAMIAREHKQQLLEKQRLELAKAAEAVNRREAESSGGVKARAPRSEIMIRRGYLDRLGIGGDSAPVSQLQASGVGPKGFDMGINARRAAIASARTRRKPPSMRVQLREAPSSSRGKGFFKKLASWIASDDGSSSSDAFAGAGASGGLTQISSSLDSMSSAGSGSPALGPKGLSANRPRHVNFKDSADVYFIPARSDYPAKVKHAIWHSRAEFVEMVMSNMDQVELELQQEAENQRRIQDLKDNPPPSFSSKSRSQKDKSKDVHAEGNSPA
mmetsp:Transcript_20240/g.36256  ORF Transcript_20240/g.36256 Transcript_20240/m.36256 type:complete len:773 (+) Transcript_20240:66-2384(+)